MSGLFFAFWRQHLRSLMQYRLDFFAGVAAGMLYQAMSLAFLWVVFQRVPSLQGWSLAQVLFLYGLSMIASGLTFCFGQGIFLLGRDIVRGDLSRMLVRPVNPLLHHLYSYSEPAALGPAVLGGAVVAAAYAELGLAWAPWQWAYLAAAVLSGAVITGSLLLMAASVSFWALDPGARSLRPCCVSGIWRSTR